MKTAALLALGLILGSASLGSAHTGKTAFAVPVSGLKIDGQLGDWPPGMATYTIAEASTAYTPVPPAGPADFGAHYQVGYDAKANTLYLAVVVEDDELVTHPEAPAFANQDLCEVYIDADHSGKDPIVTNADLSIAVGAQQYLMAAGPGVAFDQVHTNPALVGDDQHQSGVKAVFRREGTTTVYEWAIPLYASFPDQPFKAKAGKTIGFDVAVVDADGSENGNWISWSPGFKVFNSDRYGNLTLIKNYQGLGTLAGTLTDGQHAGAGVTLEIHQGDQLVGSLCTDAQGGYQQRLLPGEYTLKVKGGQGFAPATAVVAVRAGQETKAPLTLSPIVLPEILRQMVAAYQGLQTYSDTTVLEYRQMVRGEDIRSTAITSFALARPNKVRMETRGLMAGATVVSDGVTLMEYWAQTGEYVRRPAPPRLSPAEIQRFVGAPLLPRLLGEDPEEALVAGLEQATELGREQLDSQPMAVVELRRILGEPGSFFGWADQPAVVRLWIGQEDHLLHQAAYEIDPEVAAPNQPAAVPGWKWGVIERHTAIRANAELPEATFTFTPPADAVPAGTLTVPEPPRSKELVGKPAPAFALKNLEGQQTRLADFAGKVLIVDFWSVRISESRMVIPYFIELQAQYGGQGFSVVGLAADAYAQVQDVRRFAEDRMINYPVLMADEKVFAEYGRTTHLPTTFVIDKKGMVRYVHMGAPQDLLVFQREVEALLGE